MAKLTTMTIKAILILLTALSGCHSDCSPMKNSSEKSFKYECSYAKGSPIGVDFHEHTLYVTTQKEVPITIELYTFPKPNIAEAIQTVKIENCTVPDGTSFGTLYQHFNVSDGIVAFEGINVGSSLEGRFSSGFEKVQSLTLRGNKIRQLNDNVFESIAQLSDLDLSRNYISIIHKNTFEKLTQLRTLKLSRNQIKSLSEGLFRNQKQLDVLCLDTNRLEKLTMPMFQGLDSLSVLSLERNSLVSLSDDVFHHVPMLQRIYLGNTNIRMPYKIFSNQSLLKYAYLEKVKLNEGIQLSGLEKLQIRSSEVTTISGLSNITIVSITVSKLSTLPVNSFNGLRNMTKLNLSSNGITNLTDGLFDELKKLVHLQLAKNYLTTISGRIFRDLDNVIEIDLSDNRLATIHPNAFVNTRQLESINLKNNQLTFSDNRLPFLHLDHLRILNLNNNSLTSLFPSGSVKLTKLRVVDLGFNRISSLKFGEIREPAINLSSTFEKPSALESNGTRIYLNDNPLDCDCSMFDFLSRVDHQERIAQIYSHNCHKHAYHLKLCHRNASRKCPTKCNCTESESESGVHVLISCRGRQLTRVPEINVAHATSIELDVSNNRLTELPVLHSDITFIQASFNEISTIGSENLPPNLRGLDLSHNKIETIAADVIHQLRNHQSLEMFFLKDNPLACHCYSEDTKQLIEFAKGNLSITDLQGAKCNVHDDLTQERLDKRCTEIAIMYGLIVTTILLLITATFSILFIKHREFIKMWVYAHDWFIWCIDEEYVDRDKMYDVFISYADENNDLAMHLVEVLENCHLSYKFCFDKRDFLCGERIDQSVINAVKRSRRTMVILSENYLQSPWCSREFHLALERSIAEKRKIIIAIKYGDLGNVGEADETIQSYIKTHTYIESNDKWFWQKILYALPHRKQKKKNALNETKKLKHDR